MRLTRIATAIRIMSFVIGPISGLMTLTACGPEPDRKAAIAQEISQSVKLPPGASPISRYSQYYSFRSSDIIEASYVIHHDGWRNMVKRSCIEEANKLFPCDQADYGVVDAGQVRWIDNPDAVPSADGGGCTYIVMRYELNRKRFTTVECNGPY